MEEKIEKLTTAIYKEGVEKGEIKAREIIDEANAQADGIVAEAKREGEKIIAAANVQAEELKRNSESEIKLAGIQTISNIKLKLLDIITYKMIDEDITTTLLTPDVLKELIITFIKKWQKSGNGIPSVEVLLPEYRRKELDKSIQKELQQALAKEISISFTKNIKGGFQIGPKDGTYRISMTDDNFKEFFKEYLRPKTRSFLFGE